MWQTHLVSVCSIVESNCKFSFPNQNRWFKHLGLLQVDNENIVSVNKILEFVWSMLSTFPTWHPRKKLSFVPWLRTESIEVFLESTQFLLYTNMCRGLVVSRSKCDFRWLYFAFNDHTFQGGREKSAGFASGTTYVLPNTRPPLPATDGSVDLSWTIFSLTLQYTKEKGPYRTP